MIRKSLLASSLVVVVGLAGCSGMRDTGQTFVAHGECFRILGFPIPADDQQAALNHVPAGAKITNVSSTNADWTSVSGFFGNLFWFHCTHIGGTK